MQLWSSPSSLSSSCAAVGNWSPSAEWEDTHSAGRVQCVMEELRFIGNTGYDQVLVCGSAVTPLRVTYQIACISDIYITIHNSSKVTVKSSEIILWVRVITT